MEVAVAETAGAEEGVPREAVAAAADPVAADQVRVGGLEVVRGDDVPAEDAVGAPGLARRLPVGGLSHSVIV